MTVREYQTALTAFDMHCHIFSLDILVVVSRMTGVLEAGMSICRSGNGWSDEQGSEDRTDDRDGDMPVSQDYSTYPLSLSSKSTDSRFQAGKGMAICPFGFGAMDPRSNQNRREFLNTGHRNVCR